MAVYGSLPCVAGVVQVYSRIGIVLKCIAGKILFLIITSSPVLFRPCVNPEILETLPMELLEFISIISVLVMVWPITFKHPSGAVIDIYEGIYRRDIRSRGVDSWSIDPVIGIDARILLRIPTAHRTWSDRDQYYRIARGFHSGLCKPCF